MTFFLLQLLSSLATDLDIMLNDLRSSPSRRLLPSHSSESSSPITVSGSGSVGGNGIGSSSTRTGFLQSAFRSSNPHQSVQIIPSQSVPSTPQHRRFGHYRSTSSSLSNHHYQNENQQHQEPQQRFNQNISSRIRSQNTNSHGNGHQRSNSCSTAIDVQADACSNKINGSHQIQMLPLWTYQTKELQKKQQPQKLHNQMVQQQKDQASASKASSNSRLAAKQLNSSGSSTKRLETKFG